MSLTEKEAVSIFKMVVEHFEKEKDSATLNMMIGYLQGAVDNVEREQEMKNHVHI